MKKIFLSILSAISFISLNAQVTTLSQDFNASCASSSGFPFEWSEYNSVAGTLPQGEWMCAPTEGRDATPGMMCTGTYGSPLAFHNDTSYLITPLLSVASYPDSVYLRFDSKTTKYFVSGNLDVIVASDTDGLYAGIDTDFADSTFPLIGEGDLSNWVTHQVNLTSFKTRAPFYLAFRYISPDTAGTVWYLDNINIATNSILKISNVNVPALSLKVIGYPASSQINLSCTAETAGAYHLEMYDMMGRLLYKDVSNRQQGNFTYNINNLNLQPGMYLVKMSNEYSYTTCKVVIP